MCSITKYHQEIQSRLHPKWRIKNCPKNALKILKRINCLLVAIGMMLLSELIWSHSWNWFMWSCNCSCRCYWVGSSCNWLASCCSWSVKLQMVWCHSCNLSSFAVAICSLFEPARVCSFAVRNAACFIWFLPKHMGRVRVCLGYYHWHMFIFIAVARNNRCRRPTNWDIHWNCTSLYEQRPSWETYYYYDNSNPESDGSNKWKGSCNPIVQTNI